MDSSTKNGGFTMDNLKTGARKVKLSDDFEVYEGYVDVYDKNTKLYRITSQISRLREEDALLDAQLEKEDLIQGNI